MVLSDSTETKARGEKITKSFMGNLDNSLNTIMKDTEPNITHP